MRDPFRLPLLRAEKIDCPVPRHAKQPRAKCALIPRLAPQYEKVKAELRGTRVVVLGHRPRTMSKRCVLMTERARQKFNAAWRKRPRLFRWRGTLLYEETTVCRPARERSRSS